MNSPCIDCDKRGSVPGNAHSCCNAPPNGAVAMVLWLSGHRATPKANPHGVANGWCLWPMNFDPIWIESCPLKAARPAIAATEASVG